MRPASPFATSSNNLRNRRRVWLHRAPVDSNVGIIDVGTNTEQSTVPVSGHPFAVLVAPGDSVVFVTTTVDSLFGISAATKTITRRQTVPTISNGLAVCDSMLYVSTRDAGIVTEFNIKTNTKGRIFNVGGAPQGVVIAPSKATLYIANETGYVQFWNVTTNAVIDSVRIGGPGYGLAQRPGEGRLYVTTENAGQVQVIDTTTRAKVDSFLVGGFTRRIAFNAGGTIAVVANENGWVDFLEVP